MNVIERDALLVRLDERTARADKVLFGNGRSGLVGDVAVLQDDMRRREDEAAELRAVVALSHRRSVLINGGVVTAIITAVFAAAKAVFGA